jgi:hypothetical protein
LAPDRAHEVQVAPGMKLLGWTITPDPVPAGGDIGLSLFWQGAGDKRTVHPVSIRLRDSAGQDVAAAAGDTTIPQAGRGICEWYDLKVAPQSAAGPAHIQVNGVDIDSVTITR